MTEEEAKAFVLQTCGQVAFEKIGAFLALVVKENQRQNLIAPSTVQSIWARHAADSVQLIAYAPDSSRNWLDIGTGGGFPGMIVAIATSHHVMLAEPRRQRAEFLSFSLSTLELTPRALVEQRNVEQVNGLFDVISARAVASVQKLLQTAGHCAKRDTRWILPRGRLSESELADLTGQGGMFHVEQSLTDPCSSVLIVDGAAL